MPILSAVRLGVKDETQHDELVCVEDEEEQQENEVEFVTTPKSGD